MSNKDLDLPTQQELLAQFRCDEIASTAFQLFAEAIKQFPPSQGTGKIVTGLGKLMKETINIALGKLLLLPRDCLSKLELMRSIASYFSEL